MHCICSACKSKETETKKKIIYVCSPYSGDIKNNVAYAQSYSRFVVEKGMIPFAPHLLLPQYISEENERDIAMSMNKVFLSRCDELWVFGKDITPGMSEEIKEAKRLRIKIRYFTKDLRKELHNEEEYLQGRNSEL